MRFIWEFFVGFAIISLFIGCSIMTGYAVALLFFPDNIILNNSLMYCTIGMITLLLLFICRILGADIIRDLDLKVF